MEHNRQHRNGNERRQTARVRTLNAPRKPATRTDEDVHICPDCASPMVQPVEWSPVDTRRWRVELRCPECTWESSGVFPQHVLDRFDAILDEGVASLVDDLTQLERSNMEEEVDRFAKALQADLILPEDF